ncbi:hydantoinase B/oxoprolinase family protein [Ensifer sp. B1-9]|uniref:hydantoinase B/oxoprolinase family protein n=1 Tax=Ensifer sp. B1-9 TaxID=3141455 RepID=UPI003D200C3E
MLQRDLSAKPTAIELEVIRASLGGIVLEMQNSLFRTGFSTIIRESQDASCALLDANAAVVAQHVVLPLHIGAFPACTAAVLRAFGDDIAPGDAFLINDPYEGGSPHAPDMAVITPVFFEGTLAGFCASIAHKGDIGGPVPGSCSGQAREVFNEGLQLPPVRYQRAFKPWGDVERIIAANSRTPTLVLGDIRGQLGSARLGERRLDALFAKFGLAKCLAAFDELDAISERRMRAVVETWRDGLFEAERFVDDDGIELGKPVRIYVKVDKKGDTLHFDFSGSADQTRGPANIRPPLLQAACAYALISMVDPSIFIASGILKAFSLTARLGSVVNPRYPAPVNTYNPTVHAIVDAVFAALAHVVPERSRADGCGSRSIILGGRNTNTGKGYVQYEIVGGGAGAKASGDGASGTTVNQSNAKIAPIEIIESEFPTRLLAFELIRDSGGPGQFRGGLGIRRKYLNLADARFSIRSTKHVIPAEGYSGGLPGRTGDIRVNPNDADAKRLPTRCADYPLMEGDVFELETPGGGGYGDPRMRDAAKVLADVREGYVSPDAARELYGVALVETETGLAIDRQATERLRGSQKTVA